MEVSCQQLENLSTFRPNVGLITNLSPAHIDFLKSYENYKYVKSKLFKNQDSSDVAIANMENNDVLEITKNIIYISNCQFTYVYKFLYNYFKGVPIYAK